MKIQVFIHKKRNGELFVSKKDRRRLQKFMKFSEMIKENLDIEYVPDKFIPK